MGARGRRRSLLFFPRLREPSQGPIVADPRPERGALLRPTETPRCTGVWMHREWGGSARPRTQSCGLEGLERREEWEVSVMETPGDLEALATV